MSYISRKFVLIILFFLSANIFAEDTGKKNNAGSISGYIIDADTKHAISYANVLLFSADSKKQVNGIATDDEGLFVLKENKPGKYYMEIYFIGYNTKTINDINITDNDDNVEMGEIIIIPDLMSIDAIAVEGQRSPVTYQIDKKVINVNEQLTASSGTAVDVLENVPSVTVDIDGNVSLRGSSNFMVLIDGRPTIMDANDALQQISAASLENIEIITNPSAKYNPEGTAGIINLVMKKNERHGFNGMVEGNGGYKNRYGSQFILNYKKDFYQITFDVGYNQRTSYGDEVERYITTLNGSSSFRNSSGSSNRGGNHTRIRGELGLQLSPMDFIAFGGNFQDRSRKNSSDSRIRTKYYCSIFKFEPN